MKIRGVFLALVVVATTTAAEFARAEVYDLERCLQIAQDVSTRVGISREQLQTARGNVLQSYANWIPNINVNMYAGHSWAGPTDGVVIDAQGRPIAPSGFDYENYTFSLQSGVTLFDWGTNVNRLHQSKENAGASSYDLDYQKDVISAIVIR